MRTRDLFEITRKTKEMYLERFKMHLDESISANYMKILTEWKLYDEPTIGDKEREYHLETIRALKAERAALQDLRDKIREQLDSVLY